MGYLAEEAVFMPLSKKVLEESDKFTCGNDDLDDFFKMILLHTPKIFLERHIAFK